MSGRQVATRVDPHLFERIEDAQDRLGHAHRSDTIRLLLTLGLEANGIGRRYRAAAEGLRDLRVKASDLRDERDDLQRERDDLRAEVARLTDEGAELAEQLVRTAARAQAPEPVAPAIRTVRITPDNHPVPPPTPEESRAWALGAGALLLMSIAAGIFAIIAMS